MSKINQIQNALKELDGGAFQKLADSYLTKKGYSNLNSLGSVIGANKTRTGTPDTLSILPNGKYCFVEYSTQQAGLGKKFLDDLKKCFNETKTHIPISRIQEIVLCHTSTLNTDEHHQLRKKCEEHSVNLNIFGVDSISYDLLENYPGIAKDYLGINVDTGQIMPPDEFITLYGKNQLTTRLDTTFAFRDEETKNICTALEDNDLIIIQGKAGTGKTRLALECCERFTKNNERYKTLCILSRGPDIFDDLRVYFSEPGFFLILLDDANRASKFEYIVQLLQYQRGNQRIKVIATVRNYAAEKILKECQTYKSPTVIKIQPLTDEQIKELVEKEYDIRNHHYLDRIVNIAKGNPRIAMMAAKIAKETNTIQSIENVENLYDDYFSSIQQDLDELDNTSLLKVAGIVVFFRILERNNEKKISAIAEICHLTPQNIWEFVNKLHTLEIFDLYEDEIAKVSDQVLATYLFYLACFKKKVIDFGELLIAFHPEYREHFIDALNPVLNAYHSQSLMEEIGLHVDKLWKKQETSDKNRFLYCLNDFGFLKQTETLVYIKDEIEALPPKQIDVENLDFDKTTDISTPSIISILSAFQNADSNTFQMALDLLCSYLEKRPEILSEFLHLIEVRFNFHHTSHIYEYSTQQSVVKVLWNRTEQENNPFFSKVFLYAASKYLHTKYRVSESKNKNTINFITFELAPSARLSELRKTILSGLQDLYKIENLKKDVLKVFQEYSERHNEVSTKEIIKQDAIFIVPFLNQELSPSNLEHCVLVQEYLNKLEHFSVPYDEKLKKRFESNAYSLFILLSKDWTEMHTLELGYEEYKEYKKKEIKKFTNNFNLEDYKKFLDDCIVIQTSLIKSTEIHSFHENIVTALLSLAKQRGELYSEVIKYYLQQGDQLSLSKYHHRVLIEDLLRISNPEDVYSILINANHPNKYAWLFDFYEHLPDSQISQERLDQLCNLYKISTPREITHDWDYLLNYKAIDSQIISKIAEIIVERITKNANLASSLFNLFNPFSNVNKEIINHFSAKIDLLKQAYFSLLDSKQNGDHDGTNFDRFLDLDSEFIVEYIDWLYGKKKYVSRQDDHRDYSFIWERTDHVEIMYKAAEQIFHKEKIDYFYSFFHAFFGLKEIDQEKQRISQLQLKFLIYIIENKYKDVNFMKFVFGLVSNLHDEDKRELISKYIKHNTKFEDFEHLSLESGSFSWSGSAVPMHQRRIDFYKTLIPLFNTVTLLKHKYYIEQKIYNIRKKIERERKRDFMDY